MWTKPVIRILSIEPTVIRLHQPFKAHWTIEVEEPVEPGPIELTFQTDDARVMLFEHQGEPEQPVTQTLQLAPGARIRRSTVLEMRLRTGLVGEDNRDGQATALTVHARINAENQRAIAISGGFELKVSDLAERPSTKIFL